MQWIGWVIAIVAALGAGLLFVRLRDERRVVRRMREDLLDSVAEIEQLQATRQRLAGAAQSATLGQLAGSVASTVESPLASARSNVAVAAELIEDYRKLVKGYDAAVQHCLQPVEMMFGADKAGLDQLVKHVEEARRKLFIARVALEKSSALGESRQLLADAVDGLSRSTDLVEGLRRVAPSGQEQVQPVDVNEIVAAVLGLVGTQWGERIEIVREFGELPKIRAVPGQLARAFVQLAINAGHAMPDTGRLIVQTRMHGPRSVEVNVTDSGGGIADEVLPLIFEPYFSTRASALGLGLASVRGIVKAHGGSVNVRTTADVGSTFSLTLPLEASPAAASSADGYSQF